MLFSRKTFSFTLVLLAIYSPLNVIAIDTLNFNITTLWNGTEITDHEPAEVELSVNDDGDLVIEVSAPFFNSPILDEPPLNYSCPQRSKYGLWNYEVVDAVFLNDHEEYIEIEFDPRGRYIIYLLDSRGHDFLHSLMLVPNGPEVDNECPLSVEIPCLNYCNKRWTVSSVIPREYLPANITKFNAYAIHGQPWGTPRPEVVTHESLYPADPANLSEPNIHYLEGFEPIDLSLIDFEQNYARTGIWEQGVENTENYAIEYGIYHKMECNEIPEDYGAKVITTRMNDLKKFLVHVLVHDNADIFIDIPEDLQTDDSNGLLDDEYESFWFSFSNSKKESLRIAVNPYKVHNVELWANGSKQLNNISLPYITCGNDNNVTVWSCSFEVSWDLLPARLSNIQMIHVHKGLVNAEDETLAEELEFVGAICPGLPEGVEEMDWKGCELDSRTITDLNYNSDYSDIWQAIIGPQNQSTTSTSTSATEATTTAAAILTSSNTNMLLFLAIFVTYSCVHSLLIYPFTVV